MLKKLIFQGQSVLLDYLLSSKYGTAVCKERKASYFPRASYLSIVILKEWNGNNRKMPGKQWSVGYEDSHFRLLLVWEIKYKLYCTFESQAIFHIS